MESGGTPPRGPAESPRLMGALWAPAEAGFGVGTGVHSSPDPSGQPSSVPWLQSVGTGRAFGSSPSDWAGGRKVLSSCRGPGCWGPCWRLPPAVRLDLPPAYPVPRNLGCGDGPPFLHEQGHLFTSWAEKGPVGPAPPRRVARPGEAGQRPGTGPTPLTAPQDQGRLQLLGAKFTSRFQLVPGLGGD